MTPVSSISMRSGAPVLGAVLGAVLATGLTTGLLTGCGGSGDDEDDPQADPSSTVTTEATSEATEESPTNYLPVPTGVTLTEPGTQLSFGDAATIAWRPQQDTVVALDLTVDRVDVTSYAESFEGWVVTEQMKGQVPYFVRVEATNVGDAGTGDLLVPLYALSGGVTMYEPLDFREEVFEPCPGGGLPERLPPDASADLCFVYLLPEGQRFDAAAFDPVGELEPITWSGTITEIEKPDKNKDKKKDRRKRG